MSWEKIGEIGVDSGRFCICDPCYLENSKNCNRIMQAWVIDEENICLDYQAGHPGLAVIGSTIIGDGCFDVEARINEDGRKEIRIIF